MHSDEHIDCVTRDLARALAYHAAHLLDLPGYEDVDLDASLYAPEGFQIGDRALDSQDMFEVLVGLEERTGVPLLDELNFERPTSLTDLAELIAAEAEPDRVVSLRSAVPTRSPARDEPR